MLRALAVGLRYSRAVASVLSPTPKPLPDPASVGSKSTCPLLFTHDLSASVDTARSSSTAGASGFALLRYIHTRRRGGGKVGIPLRDFQGAVGAVGNRLPVFHRFHGPAFSTAVPCLFAGRFARPAIGVIAPDHVRSVTDRDVPIEVLMDGDRAAGQRVAEPALLDLPVTIADRHRVVLGHHALGLHREDPVQIRARRAAKGRPLLGRSGGELLIERPDIALPQE